MSATTPTPARLTGLQDHLTQTRDDYGTTLVAAVAFGLAMLLAGFAVGLTAHARRDLPSNSVQPTTHSSSQP